MWPALRLRWHALAFPRRLRVAPRAQAAPASADEGGPAGGPRAGARSRSPGKEPSEWALLQALDAKKLADEQAAKKAVEAKSKEEARLRLEAELRDKQAAKVRLPTRRNHRVVIISHRDADCAALLFAVFPTGPRGGGEEG